MHKKGCKNVWQNDIIISELQYKIVILLVVNMSFLSEPRSGGAVSSSLMCDHRERGYAGSIGHGAGAAAPSVYPLESIIAHHQG